MYESSNSPSKTLLKRMTRRQLKKGHFGPYIKIGIRIRFELSELIKEEDCLNTVAFPRSADWTDDDYVC